MTNTQFNAVMWLLAVIAAHTAGPGLLKFAYTVASFFFMLRAIFVQD